MRTVTVRAEIPPSRELRVRLPEDVPTGPAEIVLVIGTVGEAEGSKPTRTFGDFLDPAFFGTWRERDDITDSVEFARKLRKEAWRRAGDEPPLQDAG